VRILGTSLGADVHTRGSAWGEVMGLVLTRGQLCRRQRLGWLKNEGFYVEEMNTDPRHGRE
jgi:hypothetical protein